MALDVEKAKAKVGASAGVRRAHLACAPNLFALHDERTVREAGIMAQTYDAHTPRTKVRVVATGKKSFDDQKKWSQPHRHYSATQVTWQPSRA